MMILAWRRLTAIPAVSLAAVVLAAATSAMAAAKAEQACFARRMVNGFSAPNDRTVYLRVGVSDIYRLDLMTDCIDLTFRQELGLEDRPASAFICSPLDATVVYRATGIPQRCPVTAIHKLTPEEIKALPKRDRP
jgi:hypothetical protein